jgi:hypothetical protein
MKEIQKVCVSVREGQCRQLCGCRLADARKTRLLCGKKRKERWQRETTLDNCSRPILMIAHLVQVVPHILEHLELELALPTGSCQHTPGHGSSRGGPSLNFPPSREGRAVRCEPHSHLPHHEVLVEPLLPCKHQHPGAFRRKEFLAQTAPPFYVVHVSASNRQRRMCQ